jgi:hypothetical protein
LLVVQAVLLSVYIRSINRESASTVKIQFGRNHDYMTLDNEYDALWPGKAIESSGYIVLNKYGGRYKNTEYGAISMYEYELSSLLLCFSFESIDLHQLT